MRFCDKDEIYSRDELSAIRMSVMETTGMDDAEKKICDCIGMLSGREEDSGLLFMPAPGFGIMSRVLGGTASDGKTSGTPGPTANDVRAFIRALGSTKNLPGDVALRLSDKLEVLLEFLEGGNKVCPVVARVDGLSRA